MQHQTDQSYLKFTGHKANSFENVNWILLFVGALDGIISTQPPYN